MEVKQAARIFLTAGAGVFLVWAGWLSAPHAAEADTDVGDIAVIETDASILQPGELFDLDNRTLTFTPKSGGGYTVSVAALSFDTDLGINLALGDDASASQALSFTFPFFGVNRTTAFINSNGYLSFGSASSFIHFNGQSGGGVSTLGDASTVLNRMSGGFQRIAVLWQDWNPAAGGGVFANSLSDRLIVTWNDVPLFGTSTTATFQVVLFSSGVIQMSYQTVTTTPGGGYLVGISPGSVSQFLVTTIDLSQGSASSISTFPNSEPLVQVFGSTSGPLVHISAVARRFFNTHGDDFDQMVMFANFTHAMGNAFAFELTVQNTVSGIGVAPSNIHSFFGSSVRLQGFINMNRLALYPADPATTFLGTNSTLDILGQESGHQWLAFVQFDDGGVCSNLLLGRDLAHWSFFHDTDASSMEGNSWVDNGDGTFTTDEATARYSALDEYIMGLRTSGDVPTFFFIGNLTDPAGKTASSAPEIGVTVSGTRQDVTINQVITCEGARSPSSGFTGVNPTTTWRQAFILLIPSGTLAPSGDVTKIDDIRSAWAPYFNAATGNQGTVNAALAPVISVTPSSLDFGNVPVGSSADRTFTVRNTGGGTLTGSASTSAPFSIVGSASYSLTANASTTMTVRFSPTSIATFLANVTFTGGGGATAQVRGVGVRAFTDDPLIVGVTAIKKVHITELRAAANELRAQGGLAPFPFTDPTLTSGVTTMKRAHITELRTALLEAAAALGKPTPTFPTDPTIVAGQTAIKSAHIKELRDGVRALD
ncbi:MAG: choice-of-anchor D domain-containing protein [Candidatus Methylomirabilales bacterium]